MAASLPMARARKQFISKVTDNRLVVLIGAAGCGKSSQAPQYLLEDFGGPVLCTQPRRLATVSVARRVAAELQCPLGGDLVGYRVGGERRCTSKTQLVFATSGVQLEELRAEGFNAFAPYKVILLDEVHERSPENDLLLSCIRELMIKNKRIRLVLMSATADFKRYLNYFREVLGEDDIATVAVDASSPAPVLSGDDTEMMPSASSGAGFQVRTKFVEQVIGMLGRSYQADASIIDAVRACKALGGTMSGETLSAMHRLSRDLILHIHDQEPPGSSILVFLPTFGEIVRQQRLLQDSGAALLTRVLHSSVDTDECIAACEPPPDGAARVVILATQIAETSITVPGVAAVVDFCRTCSVFWDALEQRSVPKIDWASVSALEQRKGRTGRTCDGVVYRLLPQERFRSLVPHDKPLLQTQSLRKETLLLLASEAKELTEPFYLFSRTMDAPTSKTIDEALVFLTSVGLAGADGAPKRGAQQRFVATPKGRLVCAMPVGVEHALSVLRGARFGRLREAALCAAIDCTNPAPVPMAYTGETERYGQVVRGFFPKWLGDRDFAGRTLANLAAVEFFETNYLDAARAERLLLAVRSGAAAAAPGASRAAADGNSDGSCVVPTLQDVIDSGVPADESAWCASHGLSRLALRSAMDTADICMRAVWKCRPLFLAGSGGGGGSIRGADGWTTREDEATSGAAQRAIGFEEPFHRCKGHTCSCAKASASSGAAGAVPILADADLCETKTPTLQDLYSERGCRELLALLAQHGAPAANGDSRARMAASRGGPLCSFFTTSVGCRFGSKCRFRHGQEAQAELGWADESQAVDIPEDIPELELDPFAVGGAADSHRLEAQLQRLATAPPLPPSRMTPGAGRSASAAPRRLVVTLGDGDLSFSAALLRDGVVPPAMLVATVLGTEAQTEAAYPAGSAAKNASLIRQSGASVLYSVDATALRLSPDTWTVWKSAGSTSGPQIWSGVPWWAGADGLAVVWQFPFTGVEEDLWGNTELLARAFASLAAAWLAAGVWRGATLYLTLCNDQFSRWGVQRSARDAFFYLESSAAFDLHGFSGYAPMRNMAAAPTGRGRSRDDDSGSFFQVEKPVTFAFRMRPPPASGSRLEASVREAAAIAWRGVATPAG